MRRLLFLILAMGLAGCSSLQFNTKTAWVLENRSSRTIAQVFFKEPKAEVWESRRPLLVIPLDPGNREAILFSELGGSCGEFSFLLEFVETGGKMSSVSVSTLTLEAVDTCDVKNNPFVYEESMD